MPIPYPDWSPDEEDDILRLATILDVSPEYFIRHAVVGFLRATVGRFRKRPDNKYLKQCQPQDCPKHGPKVLGKGKRRRWRCPGCEQDRHYERKLNGTAPGYGPRRKVVDQLPQLDRPGKHDPSPAVDHRVRAANMG